MNLRFATLIAGCMLAGAAAAAYHRAESRPAASLASEAELPPPLFLQAATGVPTTAAWPPSASVAFYAEMFEQLPAATAPQPRPPQVAARDGAPQRPPLRVATVGNGGGPVLQSAGAPPVPTRNGGEPASQPPRTTAPPGVAPPQPPGVAPPQAGNDTVEIVIRDRFGRPIRVERVDRRLLAGARGYPPPPPRFEGPYPYAPYGAYGPYR
jgi:hypothetical protein